MMQTETNHSSIELIIRAISKHRALLGLVFAVLMTSTAFYAFLKEPLFESSITIQSVASDNASAFGASKLGMIGSLMSAVGDEYTYQLLDARDLKTAVINKFKLKEKWKAKKTKSAIKTFSKNYAFEAIDDEYYRISFLHSSPDTAKLVVDYILQYIEEKRLAIKRQQAIAKHALYKKLFEQKMQEIELLSDTVVQFMGNKNIYEIEGQTKQVFEAISQVDQEILRTSIELGTLYDNVWKEGGVQQKALKKKLETLRAHRSMLAHGNKTSGIPNPNVKDVPEISQKLKLFEGKLNYQQEILMVIIPQMEKYRIDLIDTTKSYLVIDPSFIDDHKTKPSKALILAIGFILSILISFILVCIVAIIKDPEWNETAIAQMIKTIRNGWRAA